MPGPIEPDAALCLGLRGTGRITGNCRVKSAKHGQSKKMRLSSCGRNGAREVWALTEWSGEVDARFPVELALDHDSHHAMVRAIFSAANREDLIGAGRFSERWRGEQRREQENHQGCDRTLCLSEIAHTLAISHLIQ